MILIIELCCHIIVKLNLQLAELYIEIILTQPKTFISKLSFLALVIYNKYVIKNSIYVHYYNMDIYRGKNNRISLLKSGDIYIKFNISSKKNISDDYVPHYHGTEFIIKINSIDKLFKKIEF